MGTMLHLLTYLALSFYLGITAAYLAPLHGMEIPTREPDIYMIALRSNHTLEQHWKNTALNLTREPEFQNLDQLNMYFVKANASTLNMIRADPGVLLVEASHTGKDPHVRGFRKEGGKARTARDLTTPNLIQKRQRTWEVGQYETAGWNLAVLVAARRLPTPVHDVEHGYAFEKEAGLGVRVYVMDTGIKLDKTEFGGRAFQFNNLATSAESPYVPEGRLSREEGMSDQGGQGTFVAGIIGARFVGVAPNVKLYNVKVTLSNGDYKIRGRIAALNDIARQDDLLHGRLLPRFSFRGSIINMSWGIQNNYDSLLLGRALDKLAEKQIAMVAPAGYGNRVATKMPCAHPTVFCVGAIDQNYDRFRLSNYGQAVDYLAPGEDIDSVPLDDSLVTENATGPALTAPHLTGAASIFMSWRGYTNRALEWFIYHNSLRTTIRGMPIGGHNLVVNTGLLNPNKDLREPFDDAGPNPAYRVENGVFAKEPFPQPPEGQHSHGVSVHATTYSSPGALPSESSPPSETPITTFEPSGDGSTTTIPDPITAVPTKATTFSLYPLQSDDPDCDP